MIKEKKAAKSDWYGRKTTNKERREVEFVKVMRSGVDSTPTFGIGETPLTPAGLLARWLWVRACLHSCC